MTTKKPYDERTDLQKIQSQWHKLTGLHSRLEWSAAVVRTATAAELAANFAIRRELGLVSRLTPEFTDTLLVWSNGLRGKLDRLLVPLTKGHAHHEKFKKLAKVAKTINDQRNAIVHQGKFCSEETAVTAISQARRFIEAVVKQYEPTFKLKDQGSKS